MLILDGITYDVDYTEISVDSRLEKKYELVTMDGILHAEQLGSFRTYTYAIGNRPMQLLTQLADHFENNDSYHTIMLYDGATTNLKRLSIIVDSVQRNVQNVDDKTGQIFYLPIVVQFRSRNPEEIQQNGNTA